MKQLTEFPDYGYCKITTPLVQYLRKQPESQKLNEEGDHQYVAWSLKSYWFVRYHSNRPRYTYDQLKKFIEPEARVLTKFPKKGTANFINKDLINYLTHSDRKILSNDRTVDHVAVAWNSTSFWYVLGFYYNVFTLKDLEPFINPRAYSADEIIKLNNNNIKIRTNGKQNIPGEVKNSERRRHFRTRQTPSRRQSNSTSIRRITTETTAITRNFRVRTSQVRK